MKGYSHHGHGVMVLFVVMCLLTPSLAETVDSPLASIRHRYCPTNSNTFFYDLHRLCPLQIPSSLPVQMDGESFEKVLRNTQKDVFTAVLFYDSESPFSSSMRSKFDILSSMFPQVVHIAVEHSMVMPSLFSRYGIHSLPALFIVSHAAEIRYYGPKELHLLAHFYKRYTGFDPVDYHFHYDATSTKNQPMVLQPWYQLSPREIIVKEPYLVFSFLFLALRGFLYFFPGMWHHVAALWMLCKSQFNLGILGESNQLLGRVVLMMDVKRVWSKLKFWKTGNFQKRARNARVWASLASVSLGESSSARPSSAVES
ncbi:unnamed protein product [Amaranthus hypochondriacus]